MTLFYNYIKDIVVTMDYFSYSVLHNAFRELLGTKLSRNSIHKDFELLLFANQKLFFEFLKQVQDLKCSKWDGQAHQEPCRDVPFVRVGDKEKVKTDQSYCPQSRTFDFVYQQLTPINISISDKYRNHRQHSLISMTLQFAWHGS